ncbi:hypothetical protein HanPSC8_Chr15g0654851 [Helianthus annuus]|nr:hypothetical protein HanPSC8_Chr15g0654851 [Helianthus annuus]
MMMLKRTTLMHQRTTRLCIYSSPNFNSFFPNRSRAQLIQAAIRSHQLREVKPSRRPP